MNPWRYAMNQPPPAPRDRTVADLRLGLVFAGLMIAIPLALKLATRFGWMNAGDLPDRLLMVLIGAFIVVTGNAIPKRLSPRGRCEPVEVQAFRRFAGWTWVLAGLALMLAWLVLPNAAADVVTFTVLPIGIGLIALRALGVGRRRPPAAG